MAASERRLLDLPVPVLEQILNHLDLLDQSRYQFLCGLIARNVKFRQTQTGSLKSWAGVFDMDSGRHAKDVVCDVCARLTPLPDVTELQCSFHAISKQIAKSFATLLPTLREISIPKHALHLDSILCFSNLKLLSAHRLEAPSYRSADSWAPEIDALAKIPVVRLAMIQNKILRVLKSKTVPSIRHVLFNEALPETDVRWALSIFSNVSQLSFTHGSINMPDISEVPLLRVLTFKAATIINVPRQFAPTPFHSVTNMQICRKCCVPDFSFLAKCRNLKKLKIQIRTFDLDSFKLLAADIRLNCLDVCYTEVISDDFLDLLIRRRYPLKILKMDLHQRIKNRRGVTGLTTAGVGKLLTFYPNLDLLSIQFNECVLGDQIAQDFAEAKMNLTGTSSEISTEGDAEAGLEDVVNLFQYLPTGETSDNDED